MIVFLVLLSCVGSESQSSTTPSTTPQVIYQDSTYYYRDPEVDDRPRKKPEKDWDVFEPGANYTINLIAGRRQFPFVVHIQLEDTGEDDWSVGILIRNDAVMSTCRAVSIFPVVEKHPKTALPILTPRDISSFRVLYASLYIREWIYTYKTRKGVAVYDTDTEGFTAGVVRVSFVLIHVGCQPYRMTNDLSLLFLANAIPFDKSWIGLANFAVSTKDFPELEKKRQLCYVASFGRNYQNVVGNYARGYKVKYRAYLADWSVCSVDSSLICNTSYDVCAKESMAILDDPVSRKAVDIQCFTTRAKVGAVCDHDRGAPIVCEGEVYGFVIRAALQSYCNSLYPLPFIIQLIDQGCWWCDYRVPEKP